MRRIAMITAALSATIAPGALADTPPPVKRMMLCGWVVNPTPGNWWLTDSIGDWTMSTQGQDSDGPEGMDLIPDLTEKDWVATNGSYGYGCGCMSATVDAKDMRILRIHSFKQKPISACRKDPKLPNPEQ